MAAKKKAAVKKETAAAKKKPGPPLKSATNLPPVGSAAPNFTLEADDGRTVSLSDYAGQTVVLYFYPKDDTTGCTAQACEFRDAFPRFTSKGAVVLGVSPDPVKKHQKFKAKYGLPFTLLADVEQRAARAYGVWIEKQLYGNRYWANARTTLIIGADGRIARIFEQVDPEGHAAEVAAALV
jgi:peroxiredoxin Q/BCP